METNEPKTTVDLEELCKKSPEMEAAYQQEKAAWEEKKKSFEQKSIETYGFYMHLVTDEPGPLPFNLHTHGFPHSWNHRDFQIVLRLPPEVGGSLLHVLADKVRAGATFEPGVEYSDILSGDYKVKFIEATENDRAVLRLIFPDKTGELNASQMMPGPFKDQFIL